MILKKSQKEKLLEWVGAGLSTPEINKLAAEYDPPFSVSRQHVDHYRRTRKVELQAIQQVDEHNALATGLALKENRVALLQQLAELMKQDLTSGFLWLDQVKSIGSGFLAKEVEYQEFNASEVAQLRGVLDDIAKEMGDRVIKTKNDTDLKLTITGLNEMLDKVWGKNDTDPRPGQ